MPRECHVLHVHYGPVFGLDFYIYDNCDKNYISFSNLGRIYQYTYGTADTRSLLAGSRRFKVDEYEVFRGLGVGGIRVVLKF